MADTSILNNVDFSFRRGSKANMQRAPLVNGSLNICMDTTEMYADIDDRRIPLSGVVIYETETEIFSITNPDPIIYYAINTNTLYHFNPFDLEWVQMTDGTSAPQRTYFVTGATANPDDHTIIFERGNGSTFSIETKDLDTTYSAGNSTYSGLSKIYSTTGTNSDGSIDQNALTTLLNGRVSTVDGTAPKAVADATGANINNTYIKNVTAAGTLVTFTKGNGSTFGIRTQDTNDNTTYSTGNSTYSGLTKLYPAVGNNVDGTMTQAAIKTALDGKLSTAGTANAAVEDGQRQNIANTYIKDIRKSGSYGDEHRIIITWGDGRTSSFETADNNDTYSQANANVFGLVKLYSSDGQNIDGTMTQAKIHELLATKISTTDKAAGAYNDGRDQQIDATYIKNVTVDKAKVTFIRGDGSTFSITTEVADADAVREAIGIGTQYEAGFTKLYITTGNATDGTINQQSLTNLLNNKLQTTATAAAAIRDNSNQIISQTYIKDAVSSGQKVLFTKGDGSTFEITTQDNNTTYAQAVADSGEEGLVKLYSTTGTNVDGAVTQNRFTTEIKAANDTSIKNVNYSTSSNMINFIKGDNSTVNFVLNNTTYGEATDTYAGLVKSYSTTGTNTDGSIRQRELTQLIDAKLDKTGQAASADKDGNGQDIAVTYIKDVSANGTTVTFTKGNGATFAIQTQDNNDTYSNATSAVAGLVKIYSGTGANTDGTMTQNAITNAISNGTVNKAKYDLSDNQIDGYIKSVSPIEGNEGVVEVIHGNGNNSTFRMLDTAAVKSTYSAASDGLVPKYNAAANVSKFLRGSGWSDLPIFQASSGTTQSGLVPAPASSEASDKYILSGDGGWLYINGMNTFGRLIRHIEPIDGTTQYRITRKDASTQAIDFTDYGSEDNDELSDLTNGGTNSTFSYNGSTYEYRIGQCYRDEDNDLVPISVANNSTFHNADTSSTYSTAYNSNDAYCNKIK